jgi:hypothetical protein
VLCTHPVLCTHSWEQHASRVLASVYSKKPVPPPRPPPGNHHSWCVPGLAVSLCCFVSILSLSYLLLFSILLGAMRPFSASYVLRKENPQKTVPGTFVLQNMFSHLLRDDSPGPPSPGLSRDRTRSASRKRKPSGDLSYSEAASQSSLASQSIIVHPVDSELTSKTEQVTVNVAKVSSLCEKVCADICETNCDPSIIGAITQMCDAIKLVNELQSILADLVGNKAAPPPPFLRKPPTLVLSSLLRL